ncbi:hypothetical+protein [Methylocapsa aurea]
MAPRDRKRRDFGLASSYPVACSNSARMLWHFVSYFSGFIRYVIHSTSAYQRQRNDFGAPLRRPGEWPTKMIRPSSDTAPTRRRTGPDLHAKIAHKGRSAGPNWAWRASEEKISRSRGCHALPANWQTVFSSLASPFGERRHGRVSACETLSRRSARPKAARIAPMGVWGASKNCRKEARKPCETRLSGKREERERKSGKEAGIRPEIPKKFGLPAIIFSKARKAGR